MVEAITEHAIRANAVLIAVMAFFHIGVMVMLGLAIWKTMTYRAPLHEEFIGAMPREHERAEHEAAMAERTGPVLEAERTDRPPL